MEREEDTESSHSPSPPASTLRSPSPPEEHSSSSSEEEEEENVPGTASVGVGDPAPVSSRRSLTPALPVQNPKIQASASGREDCWSKGATELLIDAWGERFLELSRGNLKQKHWQEVADIVSSRDDFSKTRKTDTQCKNRIDTLKKKYKVENAKGTSSTWPYFRRLDDLIGRNSHDKATAPAPPPSLPKLQYQFHQLQACKKKRSKKKSHKQLLQKLTSTSFPNSRPKSPPDPSDGFSPEIGKWMRFRTPGASGLRDMTRAILKLGEVYERVERTKLQQAAEMEKQRMVFAKELELQRMQFFMKTQLELTQLKRSGRRKTAESDPIAAGVAENHNSSTGDVGGDADEGNSNNSDNNFRV